MATRLKPHPFKYKTDDGADAVENVAYEIDGDGIFTAIIPDWLVPNLRALPGFGYSGPNGISLDRPRVHWRMSGRVKRDIDAWIYRAFEDYSKAETIEELVILYTWDAQAAFVTDGSGAIAQNGSVYKAVNNIRGVEFPPGVGWAKMRADIHAQDPCDGGFQIRLAAYVYNKTTKKRGSYQKITYKRAEDGHFSPDTTNPIHMLNCFSLQGGISYNGEPVTGRLSGTKPRVEEMPYTPEAAWFFVNALKSMCRMAKAMNDFFVDKEALQLAIQNGSGFMLSAPKAE